MTAAMAMPDNTADTFLISILRKRPCRRPIRGPAVQCASRCPPCAERSYHRSDHFRGVPVWDPSRTVIAVEIGRKHGPFDSEADVALCIAFAKLDRDGVEIVKDALVTASYTLSAGRQHDAAGPPPAWMESRDLVPPARQPIIIIIQT